MLLHYFLTSLKPVKFSEPPPMSAREFMVRARDCLSENIVGDLERLELWPTLNRVSRYDTGEHIWMNKEISRDTSPHVVRYAYWEWLANTSASAFLRRFSADTIRVWHVVSHTAKPHEEHIPKAIKTLLYEVQSLSFHERRFIAELAQKLSEHNPHSLEHGIATTLLAIVDYHKSIDPFSCDQIFAYFIELLLCERFASFDQTKGQAVLDRIVNELGA